MSKRLAIAKTIMQGFAISIGPDNDGNQVAGPNSPLNIGDRAAIRAVEWTDSLLRALNGKKKRKKKAKNVS